MASSSAAAPPVGRAMPRLAPASQPPADGRRGELPPPLSRPALPGAGGDPVPRGVHCPWERPAPPPYTPGSTTRPRLPTRCRRRGHLHLRSFRGAAQRLFSRHSWYRSAPARPGPAPAPMSASSRRSAAGPWPGPDGAERPELPSEGRGGRAAGLASASPTPPPLLHSPPLPPLLFFLSLLRAAAS